MWVFGNSIAGTGDIIVNAIEQEDVVLFRKHINTDTQSLKAYTTCQHSAENPR